MDDVRPPVLCPDSSQAERGEIVAELAPGHLRDLAEAAAGQEQEPEERPEG